MTHDNFETQIHPEESNEYFDYVSREELAADLEWDAHWASFDAELELAANVEENYEHGDYRDDLVEDELDIIDSDTSFDDMLGGLSRNDNQRDLDFLES